MKGKKGLTAALLAAIAAGCSSKDMETEYVYIDHQQTPIASLKAVSSDGDFAALVMQEKNDLEAMVFNTGSGIANMSNDPLNSDLPRAFAGHHLVTKVLDGNSDEEIKVYDAETGELVFTSQKFDWINDVLAYPDGSRILYSGIDGSHYSHVFNHAIGSQIAQKLFPSATSSHLDAKSDDGSVIFVTEYNPSTGDTLYMIKTADDSITPVINMSAHSINAISQNNAKAVAYDWHNNKIKTIDIATAGVQMISLPTGKEFDDVEYISENGAGALVELEDDTTNADEYWRLNTETGVLEFITQRETGSSYRYLREMSPDGKITAFNEYDSTLGDIILLHNAETSELYNPLPGVTTYWTNFRGFSSEGKAIILYDDNVTGDNIMVLHDPETKNNVTLGDSANYRLQWASNPTQDRNYLPICATDLATGWEVLLLEDLVNGGRKVVSQPGFDLEYIGASPDNEHLLLTGRDGTSTNLFVYDLADDTVEQVTQNTDPRLDWIYLRMHSKDGTNAYFEEGFDNGTGLLRELDYETGEVKEVSYQ